MTAVTLGLDVGLSGARAALLARDGRLLASARVRHGEAAPGARAEGEPAAWHAAMVMAAQTALAAAPEARVQAIGVGALGPCPVLLDDRLRALGPAPLFALDSRAEDYRRRLALCHGLGDVELGPDHALPKLFWLREQEPERVARAALVADATGFLVAQLCGRATMDPVTRCDYVAPGLQPPLPLPPTAPGESLAGGLLPEAARELGLPAGVPVTVGSYDSYVDLAGAEVRRRGAAGVLLGSTLVLGTIAEGAAAPSGLRATPHLGPGWFIGGWTSTAGSLLAWSRRAQGEAAVAAAASLEPGAGGLLMLPYFAGERAPHWDSDARGAVIGLSLATTAAELHRAALDAVALSARDLTEALAGAGLLPEVLRATGGGTRDGAWAQALADATGCALEIAAGAGEAMGPARLAWRALGEATPLGIERLVTPDPRRGARYRALHGLYRDLYPALAGPLHGLGRLHWNRETGGAA